MPTDNVDIPIVTYGSYFLLVLARIFAGQPTTRRKTSGHWNDLDVEALFTKKPLEHYSHAGNVESG
jgi:hypothetical protein